MSKFQTFWHSAFTNDQLHGFLALINKIYRGDELSAEEIRAANDLKVCVTDTGTNRHHETVDDNGKLKLSHAIKDSVSDPLWRKCLEELTSTT